MASGQKSLLSFFSKTPAAKKKPGSDQAANSLTPSSKRKQESAAAQPLLANAGRRRFRVMPRTRHMLTPLCLRRERGQEAEAPDPEAGGQEGRS